MKSFPETQGRLRRDDGRLARATAAAAAGVLILWGAWFALAHVDVVERSTTARLESELPPHAVDTLVSGRVVSSRLSIGKSVVEGEVLVELDAGELLVHRDAERVRRDAANDQIAALQREIEERVAAADSALAASEAEAAIAEARRAEAEIAGQQAAAAAARAETLLGNGSMSKSEAERLASEALKAASVQKVWRSEARRVRLVATSARHFADAEIEDLRGNVLSRRREIAEIESEISRLDFEIGRHQIKAPISGRLGNVTMLTPGEVVPEGSRLALVVPRGDFIIVASFTATSSIGRLHPGQEAVLSLDGFPWIRFGSVAARVKSVDGEVRDGQLRVELELIAPTPSDIPMEHGLPGMVEVKLEETSPALLVLREAGLMLGGLAEKSERGS